MSQDNTVCASMRANPGNARDTAGRALGEFVPVKPGMTYFRTVDPEHKRLGRLEVDTAVLAPYADLDDGTDDAGNPLVALVNAALGWYPSVVVVGLLRKPVRRCPAFFITTTTQPEIAARLLHKAAVPSARL